MFEAMPSCNYMKATHPRRYIFNKAQNSRHSRPQHTVVKEEAVDGLVEVQKNVPVAAEHGAQSDALFLCEAAYDREGHACARLCCVLIPGACMHRSPPYACITRR